MTWISVARSGFYSAWYSCESTDSIVGEVVELVDVVEREDVEHWFYLLLLNDVENVGWVGRAPDLESGTNWRTVVIWPAQRVVCFVVGCRVYFNDLMTGRFKGHIDFEQDVYVEDLVCIRNGRLLLVTTATSLYVYDSMLNCQKSFIEIACDGVKIVGYTEVAVTVSLLDPPEQRLAEFLIDKE